MHQQTRLFVLFLYLCLPWSLFAQERYVISYGGFSGYQVPAWVAKHLGLFDKYRIHMEVVMIPGSARQVQALLGGSLQFMQTDATGPVTAFLQGADLVVVGGAMNRFPFSVIAHSGIRRPKDLIGKKIGIVNFGGQNELSVLLALKEWNIPREAVSIVPAGGSETRLVALAAKALDATVLAPPETIKAEALGLKVLAHMSDMNAAFPLDALVTRRSFLEKNRDLVKRFLQAYSEALHAIRTNKEKTVAVYQKMLKQQDRAIIEKTYDYYAPKFSLPPRVDRAGLRTTADFVAQRPGALKAGADIEKILDESLLDELEREGFFKRLGVSAPGK